MMFVVHADGFVHLNGARYSTREPDRTKLKRQIEGMRRSDPKCEYHLKADRDVPFKVLGEAVLVLQEAGISRVGFLTEPRDVH